MIFSTETIQAFLQEIEKLSGVSTTSQAPEQPGPIKKNIGMGTLAAGGIATLAALKNPAAASKYLKAAKQVVTNPKKAFTRGMRTGSLNVTKGVGSSASASKRVGEYKRVLKGAQDGTLVNVKALDAVHKGGKGARANNWVSVGVSRGKGLKLKGADKALKSEINATMKALNAGKKVPEKQLAALYSRIQAAGAKQGIKTRKGMAYYLPGERALFPGMGVAGGVMGMKDSHDPETGRKRGVGERLARGAAGAYLGAATAPLWYSRGFGLKKGFQKAALPMAGGMAMMGLQGAAEDGASAGGKAIDKAFK